MATRALIGYLNPNNTITTTYNHFDGYPDNLGKALDRHYSTDDKAKEIANMGYVSFVEPVNGDIQATHKRAPLTVGDSDLVSSLQYCILIRALLKLINYFTIDSIFLREQSRYVNNIKLMNT